jgi:hypothetical protein
LIGPGYPKIAHTSTSVTSIARFFQPEREIADEPLLSCHQSPNQAKHHRKSAELSIANWAKSGSLRCQKNEVRMVSAITAENENDITA